MKYKANRITHAEMSDSEWAAIAKKCDFCGKYYDPTRSYTDIKEGGECVCNDCYSH